MPDKTVCCGLLWGFGQLIFSYYTLVFVLFFQWILLVLWMFTPLVAYMLLDVILDRCYVACLFGCVVFKSVLTCFIFVFMWCLIYLVFYDAIHTSTRLLRASTHAFFNACLDVFGRDAYLRGVQVFTWGQVILCFSLRYAGITCLFTKITPVKKWRFA